MLYLNIEEMQDINIGEVIVQWTNTVQIKQNLFFIE